MFWRVRISEDAGADCLESVGGNKKQVAKPSFLCNFQSKVLVRYHDEVSYCYWFLEHLLNLGSMSLKSIPNFIAAFLFASIIVNLRVETHISRLPRADG